MFRRILICCLLALLYPLLAQADTLVVSGRTQTLAAPFVIEGDEILAPLLPSLRLLGASATVNGATITLTMSGDQTLKLTLDAKTAESAGQKIPLLAAPREIDGKLYLPARGVANWLNAEARFDANTRTLTLAPLLLVTYATRTDGLVILVRSAAPLQYTSGRMSDPARTYYDFKHVSLGMLEQQVPVNQGIVERLRLSQFSASPAVVRLVTDLTADGQFSTSLGEQGHLLAITMKQGIPVPQVQPEPAQPQDPNQPNGPCKLLDLSLNTQSNKQSELVVQSDGPVAVDSDYNSENRQLVLRLTNGLNAIPTEHLRVGEDSVVAKIEADGSPTAPGTRLTVTFKKDAGYLITHDAAGLHVTMGTFSLADMVVVLDAGHGGHDTGATGVRGTCEKDINLDVILRTAKLLKEVGATVLLTRSDDTFIPLDDRPGLANTRKADVFVAVHCNSSASRNSGNGTQTYYKTAQSVGLASAIHDEVNKSLDLKDGGIRTANFLVIRKSLMPSVLVELAFINNEREECLLCNPAFRQKAAEGIVNGLRHYAASNAWKLRRGEISLCPIDGNS